MTIKRPSLSQCSFARKVSLKLPGSNKSSLNSYSCSSISADSEGRPIVRSISLNEPNSSGLRISDSPLEIQEEQDEESDSESEQIVSDATSSDDDDDSSIDVNDQNNPA